MSSSVDNQQAIGSVVKTICAAVLLVGIAVNLPIPMYRHYAELSGGGPYTMAFSCYGLGVLPALFFFGGISDRIGRRIVLQAALIFCLIAIGVLLAFPGLPALAVSRFAQGLAIGFVGAAATAYLAESLTGGLTAERAAAYVTFMLALGYALGALLTGLCLFLMPTRPPLSFLLHMVATATVLLMFWNCPNRRPDQRSALLRLPLYPPGAGLPCLAIGIDWCLVGVVLSIVPVELSRHHLAGWSGVASFLMPMAGLIAQPLARRLPPIPSIRLGLLLTPLACLILALGTLTDSLALVMLGAVVCGVAGVGFGFQGGLAAVSRASGGETARSAAGFFLASYIGLCGTPLMLGLIFAASDMGKALLFLTMFLLVASLTVEIATRPGVIRLGVRVPRLNIQGIAAADAEGIGE